MTHTDDEQAKPKLVTTETGRILRVDPRALMAVEEPVAKSPFVDPARREDVLFRVRREKGQEASPWWGVAAFVIFSTAVVLLLGWVPGSA